jgi:hypothetical protein
MAMPISAAGQALGLGGMAGITGMAGLGDAMETEEERERRWPRLRSSAPCSLRTARRPRVRCSVG